MKTDDIIRLYNLETKKSLKKTIVSYFTLKYAGLAFTDAVSGKRVKYYRDCYGETWMKNSRWGFFRVKRTTIDLSK